MSIEGQGTFLGLPGRQVVVNKQATCISSLLPSLN